MMLARAMTEGVTAPVIMVGDPARPPSLDPAPASAVLAAAGRQPITLRRKEGLALVNGASAMAGLAALNGVRARRLLRTSTVVTCGYAEVLGGRRSAWHPLAAEARPHPGQRRATALLWAMSADAPRLQPFEATPPRIGETGVDGTARAELPQDAYSIRCAPQLLGAVDDQLLHHDRIVADELTAVTDNPLVFPEEDVLLHAGNFFGQHVSFASDALFNAVAMLGVSAERQVARVTDPQLNRGLPPFLQGNATGLNSGFMGAQVTASALVAELREVGAGLHPVGADQRQQSGRGDDGNDRGAARGRGRDRRRPHPRDRADVRRPGDRAATARRWTPVRPRGSRDVSDGARLQSISG